MKNGATINGKLTSEYGAWTSMKTRCLNPNSQFYRHYGGRGIQVCSRWMKFANFLEDMGRKPNSSLTLERKNNNGNYEPGNCCWDTSKAQNRNRRSNRLIRFRGRSMPLIAWANELGVSGEVIASRIKAGWSLSEALTIPKVADGFNRRGVSAKWGAL